MEYKSVKFIVDHSPYVAGDIARFHEKRARILAQRGIAIMFDGGKKGDGANLKNIATAPETKHIPSAPETRHIAGPEETKSKSQDQRISEMKKNKKGKNKK